jgi:hypothetical protein
MKHELQALKPRDVQRAKALSLKRFKELSLIARHRELLLTIQFTGRVLRKRRDVAPLGDLVPNDENELSSWNGRESSNGPKLFLALSLLLPRLFSSASSEVSSVTLVSGNFLGRCFRLLDRSWWRSLEHRLRSSRLQDQNC